MRFSCARAEVATKLTPAHVVTFSDQDPIVGVTSLSDQLFVLRQGQRHVDVYDTASFAQQQRLAIDGFGESANFWGLAACAVHNFLYVSDHVALIGFQWKICAVSRNRAH
jgi:hypothetical protein